MGASKDEPVFPWASLAWAIWQWANLAWANLASTDPRISAQKKMRAAFIMQRANAMSLV
jgi:hypothetical protein